MKFITDLFGSFYDSGDSPMWEITNKAHDMTDDEKKAFQQRQMAQAANAFPAAAEQARAVAATFRVVPLETLRRLAALLERIQWSGDTGPEWDPEQCCPDFDSDCFGTPEKGHREDCELAALRGVLEGLLR